MNALAQAIERFGAEENVSNLELDASGCAAISLNQDRTLAIEQSATHVLVYLLQAIDHQAGPLALRAMQAAHYQLSPGRCLQLALRPVDSRLHLLVLTRLQHHDLDEHHLREAVSDLSTWLDAVYEAH